MDSKENVVLKASGWDPLYVPSPNDSNYVISGTTSQVITFNLATQESIKAEPSTMMHMSPHMKPEVNFEGGFGRCCGGECCCAVTYTPEDERAAFLALTPSFPTAKVVPVNLSLPEVNGRLIAQPGAYMASYGEVLVDVSFDCNLATSCCAGTGLVRQKLEGKGTVFLAATGTIVQKILEPGEVVVADGECILAFASSVKIDIRRVGSLVGMIGGGEGIFNTTLTGPGLVLIQSMNQTKFLQSLQAQKIYRR